MKIIIAGSRSFDNYSVLEEYCDQVIDSLKEVGIIIVSGTAKGADKLGERYAKNKGFKIAPFPADWDKFGKSAGYKRNEQMALYSDVLIAFWDGSSKGTKHMIDLAKKHNLKVFVYEY